MGLFDIFFKEKSLESPETHIKKKCDFSNFEKVLSYLYEKSGITDLDKRAIALSALQRFAKEEDVCNTDEFLQRISSDNDFYQNVLNIITVNETFFFRELKELEWLVEYVKKSSQRINILSLPCSSGEEVYSILILLDQAGIDLSRVKITGYDINSEALTRAREGVYNEHSLHKVGELIKSKYFSQLENGKYEIVSKLKRRVNFFQKNIFELKEESSFDIILSRNMFIYFNEQKRAEATDIIVKLLKHEGIFIKGHADGISKHEQLEMECYGVYCRVKH